MKKDSKQISSQLPSDEHSLQLFLPAVTKREISLRAAEAGETIRVIVLRALEAYGFQVPKDALVDRRKPQ